MKVRSVVLNELCTILLCLICLSSLICASTVKAQTLVEKKLPELNFKIQQLPPHSLQIEVSNLHPIKGAEISATSSYLPNPARIVLDIQGVKISKNLSFPIKSEAVKGVRLGIHPDRCRFVIDLAAEGAISSAVEQTADNRIILAFSVKKSTANNLKDFHQPVKAEPTASTIQSSATSSTPMPKHTATHVVPTNTNTPTVAKSTATPAKKTPTPKATNTAVVKKMTAVPTQKTVATSEAISPIIEESSAQLPVRKVPAPAITVQPTTAPQARSTDLPKPTALPTVAAEAPLSSLIDGKANPSDMPTNGSSSASEPLSHESLGSMNNQDITAPIGPKDASQYLAEVHFDYQIQDHDPLLRLVMMSGANFNLIKKEPQLYQLIVPKSGIKSKELAQPLFPPHDFVGFTLVHPRYENDALIVDIGVDRGARISAFARGNEIWVRGVTK